VIVTTIGELPDEGEQRTYHTSAMAWHDDEGRLWNSSSMAWSWLRGRYQLQLALGVRAFPPQERILYRSRGPASWSGLRR